MIFVKFGLLEFFSPSISKLLILNGLLLRSDIQLMIYSSILHTLSQHITEKHLFSVNIKRTLRAKHLARNRGRFKKPKQGPCPYISI